MRTKKQEKMRSTLGDVTEASEESSEFPESADGIFSVELLIFFFFGGSIGFLFLSLGGMQEIIRALFLGELLVFIYPSISIGIYSECLKGFRATMDATIRRFERFLSKMV